MSTTVKDFAKELNRPLDELLGQLKEAGVSVKDAASAITGEDKLALLTYLKQKTRAGTPAAGEPKRITLKRKETSEIKLGTGRGATAKTVSVVVQKRRTYVKRDAAGEELSAAEAAEAAKEQAEREATAHAAAAAEAKRHQDEAEKRMREEEDARKRAALEAQKQIAETAKLAPTDPARIEAEAQRRRAEENLRRTAERPAQTKEERERAHRESNIASRGKAIRPGRPDRKTRRAAIAASNIQVDTQHAFEKPVAPQVREIEIPEFIMVGELANRMAVKSIELIKVLMGMGVMVTINQSIDQTTAQLAIEEMGHKAKPVKASDAEESLIQAVAGDIKDAKTTLRAPIVTVMGHVDHGKTSLLDYIRKTRVAAGEAGGITQHIGAYHVQTPKGVITFLDTPGHAAFTRMRARGAQLTDIVILVVAGDDSVMPQTKEAIAHAKAAKVPMVVAVTKMDKHEASADKVKNDLLKEEVVAEDFGGEVQVVPVSAQTGKGVTELLEAVLLQAEVLELKAAIDTPAKGSIIESSLEKGRGAVATILVRSGTLRQGDVILTGPHFGRVRAMFDEAGKPVKEAGPSIPVQVLGLSGVPDAGDDVVVVADERKARELAEIRLVRQRETKLAQNQAVRMEQVFAKLGEGGAASKALNLMVRADVQGSMEAICEALRKLPSAEVRVVIVSATVGGITESDVDLALASKAIIIGFNARAEATARKRLQEAGVDVRYYSIIYELIDDVSSAIQGLLGTEIREQIVGTAEVRDVFRSSKFGAIAGCLVMEGEVRRSLPVRVLRNNVVIFEGELDSLRRFKDDVQKVESGTECGIGVKNYNDIKAGDSIECFAKIEVQRKVTAAA